jgi:hypothetical protein
VPVAAVVVRALLACTGVGSVPWTMSGTARAEARHWFRRKRIFYTIVGVYGSLSIMWFAIDLLDDSSGYWFY